MLGEECELLSIQQSRERYSGKGKNVMNRSTRPRGICKQNSYVIDRSILNVYLIIDLCFELLEVCYKTFDVRQNMSLSQVVVLSLRL